MICNISKELPPISSYDYHDMQSNFKVISTSERRSKREKVSELTKIYEFIGKSLEYRYSRAHSHVKYMLNESIRP